MTDGEKERIKLRATFLNNVAVGAVLVGVLTPVTRAAYDPSLTSASFIQMLGTAAICLSAGFGLHVWASRHLRRLDQ